ncbi:MAG: cobalamin biosynthesis protein [Gemmatales bacterium]|nr:cobalamin biosynthesis protein [Gemmatales bacterium]MDW8222839.1 cobalamin biosynthesis protein [Gemmatales bacterium]
MLGRLQQCAQRWGWRRQGVSLSQLEQARTRGAKIGVFQDAGRTDWWTPSDGPPDDWLPLADWSEAALVDFLVVISDRLFPLADFPPTLLYRPRTLTMGLSGPDTGNVDEFEEAVQQMCEAHGLSWASLTALATVQGDPGCALFEECAERLEIPLLCYPPARLAILPSEPGFAPAETRLWQTQAVAMLAAAAKNWLIPAVAFGDWYMALARRQTG